MHSSVAVLFFARYGYLQRQGMQTALSLRAGVDDSQSVELRDRGGMAVTVLTLQQSWIAPPGFAIVRGDRAGQVHYHLLRRSPGGAAAGGQPGGEIGAC